MTEAVLQQHESSSRLIERLLSPDAYSHPVADIELIETHISWVILTGEFVYKIKKPLSLGFLDFRTLEQRRHYCEEEIRLNKPWAPRIYLDVVPITVSDSAVRVGGDGTAVEYAVRMRSFEQAMRLDAQLDSGNLSSADMYELAEMLATRHRGAPVVAAEHRETTVIRAIDLIRENFGPLAEVIDRSTWEQLHRWTLEQIERLEPFFRQRFDDGFFRDCHGDLHLGNLVRLPEGITTFDCIEFSDELRHIDVMADIAFLIMDLAYRGDRRLAYIFLNRYLEIGGDYSGMRMLNLYYTYRCLVRAKISVIRSQEVTDPGERRKEIEVARRYCELARLATVGRQPVLMAMCGLSGSGKTWVSEQLMSALPAIRVRSDIERKRKFGIGELDSSESGVASGIYERSATAAVYAQLYTAAGTLLSARHDVILDASFLSRSQREAARDTARRCGAAYVQIELVADEALLRERVRRRLEERGDVSEADTSVLDYQLRTAEPPTEAEFAWTVRCRSDDCKVADLVERIVCMKNRQSGTGGP